ncbi:hypothetical protein [Agarivorans litoreus]|uniref:hypothetical protein n=1 Tax=Agarivorans litoreus TaxID=1510455 RepID=UPI001C7D6AD1|nr:hypothetical protein [Agarivorans litoreus]
MTDTPRIRIAINVMRARLTVVGFNIAIVSFQISDLAKMAGGMPVPGLDHAIHFRADMALFMALAFSLLSLVAFISSSAIDEAGTCDHWSFIVGDLLMYLGLANTVTGFFSPLSQEFLLVAKQWPAQELPIAMFRKSIMILGSLAWFSAIYLGPAVTLIRSPFHQRINVILLVVYVLLLIMVFWINYQVYLFEVINTVGITFSPIKFLYEFIQPVVW